MVHTKYAMPSNYDGFASLAHAQMKSAANWPDDAYNFRPSTSVSRAILSERGIDICELETTEGLFVYILIVPLSANI